MDCLEFLDGVVTSLTGAKPDINVVRDECGAVIYLGVNGKFASLLGKNGDNINAIRTISKALGLDGKHRIKIVLDENAR